MEKVIGSNPICRSKICVYVVVVANDLAMVEAPVRARIDALKCTHVFVSVNSYTAVTLWFESRWVL